MRIGTVEIGDGALLAPMAGITEMPFRALCRRMGADLVYPRWSALIASFIAPPRLNCWIRALKSALWQCSYSGTIPRSWLTWRPGGGRDTISSTLTWDAQRPRS